NTEYRIVFNEFTTVPQPLRRFLGLWMWKKYKVRPASNAQNKKETDIKYCQFDVSSTQKDYVYTEEWITHLIEKEIRQ
ncbi:hypothetical protein ACFLZV_07520, partial [Candidatus Margulisiibacteriota bacterium]